jgi:hypothetical protein
MVLLVRELLVVLVDLLVVLHLMHLVRAVVVQHLLELMAGLAEMPFVALVETVELT